RVREEAPENKSPSVQTTQFVGALESGAKQSTYSHRKKYLIKEKEKTHEEEFSNQEESPKKESPTGEEDKKESP
ncbi:hypothetical protein KI387_035210, partial [Taxus chinensis]